MTTNSCPVEDVLADELLGFLNIYDSFAWDPETKLWTLMSSRITQDMLDTIIMMGWMEDGITRKSDYETLMNMTSDEVVAMVEEITEERFHTIIELIVEEWMETGITKMTAESQDVKGHPWSKEDVKRLVAWMEDHQDKLCGKQAVWHKDVKDQVFGEDEWITVKRIKEKA
ncbi:hypothetical protein BGX38DRAFT_1276314 [Terfezia claveryi]|nr:hypothetical protein BGX38DRAFT_1276314 [Terfezia claveryi]